jgi:hypothetical protein
VDSSVDLTEGCGRGSLEPDRMEDGDPSEDIE